MGPRTYRAYCPQTKPIWPLFLSYKITRVGDAQKHSGTPRQLFVITCIGPMDKKRTPPRAFNIIRVIICIPTAGSGSLLHKEVSQVYISLVEYKEYKKPQPNKN